MEKKNIENLELNRVKIELGNLKTKLRITENKLKDLEVEHNTLYNDSLKTISSYKKLHDEYIDKSDAFSVADSKLNKIKKHWILKHFL